MNDKEFFSALTALLGNMEGGPDLHEHRCECGERWQHSSTEVQGSSEVWHKAHTCPACGKGPWTIKFPCILPSPTAQPGVDTSQ